MFCTTKAILQIIEKVVEVVNTTEVYGTINKYVSHNTLCFHHLRISAIKHWYTKESIFGWFNWLKLCPSIGKRKYINKFCKKSHLLAFHSIDRYTRNTKICN